jgi:hypothetical protein
VVHVPFARRGPQHLGRHATHWRMAAARACRCKSAFNASVSDRLGASGAAVWTVCEPPTTGCLGTHDSRTGLARPHGPRVERSSSTRVGSRVPLRADSRDGISALRAEIARCSGRPAEFTRPWPRGRWFFLRFGALLRHDPRPNPGWRASSELTVRTTLNPATISDLNPGWGRGPRPVPSQLVFHLG